MHPNRRDPGHAHDLVILPRLQEVASSQTYGYAPFNGL
jgi:hypothetical protein